MNSSPDRFHQLKRLLTLKRHEPPPPGYFHDFSAKVIGRIEAGDLAVETNGWERFLAHFDTKPVLVCAYGLLVCGGLLFGLSFVQMMEGDPTLASQPVAAAHWSATARVSVPPATDPVGFLGDVTDSSFGSPGGTLPATPEPPSFLFDGTGVKATPATYNFNGRY